ncbi:winged helix-turn-helix transcriptional regulator [Paenibacillus alkalitolerans]|uniref:winged helix-turn-helix transcriptional regulator n=1 Tax=Paenibacillus alkalitolerans TaxID=2799335 RepID=UPI0018F76186|nr:helix-turn-helix domain-containing protein [Paenibacillus alkalitolerans]
MGKLGEAAVQRHTHDCSIEKALNVIGGKWSFLVIRELTHGKKRFGELKSAIHDVSSKSLSDTLRHLQEKNILIRKAYATVPPTVEYELTEKGQSLQTIIHEMKKWGKEWANEKSGTL